MGRRFSAGAPIVRLVALLLAERPSFIMGTMEHPRCKFELYNRTICARNSYRRLHVTGIESCCQACTSDNQCQGFEFGPSANSSQCSLVLGGGLGRWGEQDGVVCGSRFPLPQASNSSHTVDKEFDCGVRSLALRFATSLVGARAEAGVFEALQLAPACNVPPPAVPNHRQKTSATLSTSRTAAYAHMNSAAGSAVHFWVSPAGRDNASGLSRSQAWRTLPRVLQAIDAMPPPRNRPHVVVNLMGGTYYLKDSLSFSAAHSGVTFQAASDAAGQVDITGAVDLSSLEWHPSSEHAAQQQHDSPTVWSAHIPADLIPSRFDSLFAAGQRQFRARWPNGDPETYCPRDRHGGQCPGYAQVRLNETIQPVACPDSECIVAKSWPNGTNVNIFAKESGELIAQGAMEPLDRLHNIHVTSPNPAWQKRKLTYSTAQFYEKLSAGAAPSGMAGATNGSFQVDRFDTRVTKAFWNTAVPSTLPFEPSTFAGHAHSWMHPELAVVHVYQTEYWGIWMFQLESIDWDSHRLRFSRGGWQEARGGSIGGKGGRGHPQDYFIENVYEELDDYREFYYNTSSSTLFWAPPKGADGVQANPAAYSAPGSLLAPTIKTLLDIRGESADVAVHDINFIGINLFGSLPTFMERYEPTSGGDWAVHRGAAVQIENATDIILRGCRLQSIEGNGILLSNFVRNCSILDSEISGCGDTPLLLLGSANLMDGTSGSQPWFNTIAHNYIHHWGVWGRQAAGYFEGLAAFNNVSCNVFHDGPRAGANFNDGFGGGLLFHGNLLFNVVQDTGEHGVTNSWDRQPMLYKDHLHGGIVTAPATRSIANNFVFRNSFRGPTSNKWGLDKDDGSSNYDESGNVIMYGGIKDRDGLWRIARNNLIVFPDRMPFEDTTHTYMAIAFQTNEFQWDQFYNNTVITSSGFIYACSSKMGSEYPLAKASNLRNNTFLYPTFSESRNVGGSTNLPFQGCDEPSQNSTIQAGFAKWQADGFDKGSVQVARLVSAAGLVAIIEQWLPL